MSSYYRVRDAKGKLKVDATSGHGCYGSYTGMNSNFTGTNIVELDVRRADAGGYGGAPFSSAQIKEFCIGLGTVFPNRMHEERNKWVITLDEAHYFNFSHMRAMLDYARLLWEGTNVARAYFGLPEGYRQSHDFFMLIQAISILNRPSGHPVPSSQYRFILPTPKFLEICRNNRKHHKGCLQLWYDHRLDEIKSTSMYGGGAERMWSKTPEAGFIQEVEQALQGKMPSKIISTVTPPKRATAPLEPAEQSKAAATLLRKIVRRKKPVAEAVG